MTSINSKKSATTNGSLKQPVEHPDGKAPNGEEIKGRNWQLTKERASYRALFEQAADAIVIIDESRKVVEANASFATLLGYTLGETLQLYQWDWTFEYDTREKLLANWPELPTMPMMLETRFISKDGAIFDVEIRHVPDEFEHGKVLFLVCRDITERKHLEISLRESERRFHLASWATKDVIWERDLIANTIFWNESLRMIFHFPVGEIEPTVEWWQDHLHPAERDKVINSIEAALEQGQDFWSKEYRFRLFDGSYANIFDRGYILYNEQAKPMQMVGAMIDITGKKLAEDVLEKERAYLEERTAELATALRETEGLFSTVQAILKSANLTQICQNLMEHFMELVKAERINLYLVDHEHREIPLNLVLGDFQDSVPMTYQELNAGIAGQVFRSGQPVLSSSPDDGIEPPETYERRVRNNAGSLIVMPLLTREGAGILRVIGIVVVINSIGQRAFTPHDKDLLMMMATQAATAVENIRLYEDAQRARDAADAANKSKSDFLANMSHEIRTPMNAIIGLTRLVLDMDLDDLQRSYLQKVQISSKALLGLLNDILDYSKIEAGKLDLEAVDFDLDENIRNTIELFSGGAEEKGIELVFEIAPEVPQVLNGDPLRLGQVLNNLVGNAVKFTGQGEVHVRVKVNKSEGGKIWLQFSVRDTGIGMTEKQIEGLFNAFSQADTSTARRFGGTGLGLTISKRLVEIMGGEIGVESVQGYGSMFHFMVPLQPARGESPLRQIDNPNTSKTASQVGKLNLFEMTRPIHGAHVLVVEDNITNQLVAKGFLEKMKLLVDIAGDGQQAIDKIAAHNYAVVLMDLQMPIMDGFEATRRIRSMERGRNLPIIAMTAAVMQKDKDASEAAGMNGHIAKPINVEELVSMLLAWVPRSDA